MHRDRVRHAGRPRGLRLRRAGHHRQPGDDRVRCRGNVTITNHLNQLPPELGSLKVIKDIPDVPEGFTGSFDVGVKCTDLDTITKTISFPDPGFVTIDDLPAGAVCAVLETSRSDAPDGFQWAGPLFAGTATIVADQTTDITVTNMLAGAAARHSGPRPRQEQQRATGRRRADVSEGDTVTYTLAYAVTDGPVTNGVLTDVLPAGVTYVSGSATDSTEFEFVSYDSGTRTLTWTADS